MLAWHLKHEREMTWAEWFGIWHLWFLWAHSLDKRYGANMPGAEAEAKAAAMDNVVDVWRFNTASRLHWELTEGLDAHRMVTESQFHPTGQRKAWPNPQHTGENPVHVALQVHEPGVAIQIQFERKRMAGYVPAAFQKSKKKPEVYSSGFPCKYWSTHPLTSA